MDLNDLEMYANFKHGEEFLKIPSSIIGKKSVIEWFVVDDISYWWFIAPMIHAKFKSATMFLDQLSSAVSTHNIDKILPIINGESKISLRLVDWFVTNYSKKNYTIIENKNKRFKVYTDYKLMINENKTPLIKVG